MGLLDYFVDPYFLDEKAGRVVVFVGDRRSRGYLVRSESEEQKIRAFLKMYYSAELAIQLVSTLLTIVWITDLTLSSENSVAHLLKSGAIFLGIYSLIVALPYWSLRRTYKNSWLSFVSAQDEVSVSGRRPSRKRILIGVGLIVFCLLILAAVLWLIQSK